MAKKSSLNYSCLLDRLLYMLSQNAEDMDTQCLKVRLEYIRIKRKSNICEVGTPTHGQVCLPDNVFIESIL